MPCSSDKGFADFNGFYFSLNLYAKSFAARISDRSGAVIVVSCGQQTVCFIFIAWCHEKKVRDTSQERDIKATSMSWAIFANQTCPVDCKQHV